MKFLFLLLLPFFLMAQSVVDEPEATKPETTQEEPKKQKPLKHESGTVSMDPKIIALNLKNTNLIILKRLKISLLNFDMEPDYKSLMKSYIEATILLQERKFPEARRAFEENSDQLNEAAQKIYEKNKEVHDKLLKNTSEQIIEMKIDAEPGDLMTSMLEKNIAQATDISMSATDSALTKNYVDALEKLKRSNFQLLRIITSINRHKNKELKVADRVQKKLFIEEDFLPPEYIRLYDDSRNQLFEEKEEERRKERESVLKNISARYGDINIPEETNTTETQPKSDTDTPETKPEEK